MGQRMKYVEASETFCISLYNWASLSNNLGGELVWLDLDCWTAVDDHETNTQD